jgi:hypothetical protein
MSYVPYIAHTFDGQQCCVVLRLSSLLLLLLLLYCFSKRATKGLGFRFDPREQSRVQGSGALTLNPKSISPFKGSNKQNHHYSSSVISMTCILGGRGGREERGRERERERT